MEVVVEVVEVVAEVEVEVVEVVVVVELSFILRESLLLKRLNFAKKHFRQCSWVKCVFFDTSNNNCHFSWKTVRPTFVVVFGKKAHF